MSPSTTWSQTTPFGPIEVTLGPHGLERITLSAPERDFVSDGGRFRDPTNTKSRRVALQLAEWCAGTRRVIDVPVDLEASELSEFQVHALRTLRAEVPWGETVTYGELAELAGRPGAARAVGTAMARNPVPFVIPCHRVVAANGIGGYGGGTAGVALKRRLLAREGPGRSTG